MLDNCWRKLWSTLRVIARNNIQLAQQSMFNSLGRKAICQLMFSDGLGSVTFSKHSPDGAQRNPGRH